MICCKGNVRKCSLQEDIYNDQRDICSVFIVQNIHYQGQRESLFIVYIHKIRNLFCSITMGARGGRLEGKVVQCIGYNMKTIVYNLNTAEVHLKQSCIEFKIRENCTQWNFTLVLICQIFQQYPRTF